MLQPHLGRDFRCAPTALVVQKARPFSSRYEWPIGQLGQRPALLATRWDRRVLRAIAPLALASFPEGVAVTASRAGDAARSSDPGTVVNTHSPLAPFVIGQVKEFALTLQPLDRAFHPLFRAGNQFSRAARIGLDYEGLRRPRPAGPDPEALGFGRPC